MKASTSVSLTKSLKTAVTLVVKLSNDPNQGNSNSYFIAKSDYKHAKPEKNLNSSTFQYF